MKEVDVTYYAALRETAGRDSEKVPLESGDTGAALYLRLAERHGFGLKLSELRLAVNDAFFSMEEEIPSGAKVVFIPPVAGG